MQNYAKLPASMLISCPGWSLMTWTLCFDLSQSETAERSRLDKRLSRSRKTEMSTYRYKKMDTTLKGFLKMFFGFSKV